MDEVGAVSSRYLLFQGNCRSPDISRSIGNQDIQIVGVILQGIGENRLDFFGDPIMHFRKFGQQHAELSSLPNQMVLLVGKTVSKFLGLDNGLTIVMGSCLEAGINDDAEDWQRQENGKQEQLSPYR